MDNNVKEYELFYFVSITNESDSIADIKQKISDIIAKHKGIIIKEEEVGKKKLAFAIKNARHGYYILVHFTADTTVANTINDTIRLMPEILRHKIVIKKNYKIAPPMEGDKPAEVETKKESAPAKNEENTKPSRPTEKEEGKTEEPAPKAGELKEDAKKEEGKTEEPAPKAKEEAVPANNKEDTKVDIAELDRKLDELLSEHDV